MLNKKCLLLLSAILILATAMIAQPKTSPLGPPVINKSGSYDYDKIYPDDYNTYDSVFIKNGKREDQHLDWMNRKYPYPAKPRDMWEIGLKGGTMLISGDVPVQPGFGFGGHIRKSFGYVFSLQGEFVAGTAYGEHYKATEGAIANNAFARNHGINPALTGRYDSTLNYANTTGFVYHNYQTKIRHAVLEGVVSLNNLKFHKRRTKWDVWGYAGGGGMLYSTMIDQLDGDGNTYDYTTISTAIQNPDNGISERKDILESLRNLWDGEYETSAEIHGDEEYIGEDNPSDIDQDNRRYTYQPIVTAGVGIAYKLGRRVSLALVHKGALTNDDLLDGQRWQENGSLTRNFDTYHTTMLNLGIHLGGKKSVEPLWWLNPLDYAYDELLYARPQPIELLDTDKDCVPDIFDKEPNSPENCPVDHCGVILDTDGDGVPDCKDKELITPTYCQPVNADGVGDCPDRFCDPCSGPVVNNNPCDNMTAGASVGFSNKSYCVNDNGSMSTLADAMRQCPMMRVNVAGNADEHANPKCNEKLAWLRSKAVIDHMVSKYGFSRDRFISTYAGYSGAGTSVSMSSAGSGVYGSSNPADPHPSLNCGTGCR